MGFTVPTSKAKETRLVIAASGGCHSAYESLVTHYQRPLFRFLRMRCGNREDAEEILQEAFLRVWTKLHRYDATRTFSSWLYTVAANLAVSASRKRKPVLHRNDSSEHLAGGQDPATVAEHREQRDNLWDAASEVLTMQQRSALWLTYAEGRSTREIGQILGKNEIAVRVTLHRARQRLGKHLQREIGATLP